MSMWLRQSTASQEILLGPFVDDTDGKTAETGLTIANTDIKIWKEGGTSESNKNSGGATHIASGRYYAVLDATDTNTLGKLEVSVHVSGALPVRREFMVVPAMIYDSLILGSDRLDTNVTHISDTAQTARDIGASVLLSSGTGTGQVKLSGGYVAPNWGDVGNPTTTVGLTGTTISTSQAVASVSGAVGSVTGNVGGNVTGSVGSVVGAINTGSGSITTLDGLFSGLDAGHTSIASDTSTLLGRLTATRAGYLDNLSAGAVALEATAQSILTDTAEIGAAGAGLTAIPWNAAWDAEVQSECADALAAYDPPTNTEMVAAFTEIKGATWSSVTDTLEAIRDQGDAAWTTATGFSTLDAAGVRAAVGLASANLDTQLADLPTVAEFEARTPSATAIGNVEIVFNTDFATNYSTTNDGWRTYPAGYYDQGLASNQQFPNNFASLGINASGHVSRVVLVDTTTTNTDMRGTDSAYTGTPPTAAQIRTEMDSNSTQLAAIVADTNELQTDWANGGRLDLILDARASQTSVDDVPTNAELSAALAAADDAILAAIAALNNLSAAQVNAEVVDALATDTYAEPGSVPAATASLKDKIGWLMALSRNKITQTSTTQTLRNDADSGNIGTASISDDETTSIRGEWS